MLAGLCQYVSWPSVVLTRRLRLQTSTSGGNHQHQSGRSKHRLKGKEVQQPESEQQTRWDFRVMTYNILAEGLVRYQ